MDRLYAKAGRVFRWATQDEIDAAASEKLRREAEVGRKVADLFLVCNSFTITKTKSPNETQPSLIHKEDGGYAVADYPSLLQALDAALVEAGLTKEEVQDE